MNWDPIKEMREFQKGINKRFESFFNKPHMKGISTNTHHPASDIIEKEGSIIVKVDLPGIEKEDIEINATPISLEIKAEKKHEIKIEKKGYYKHERSYGGFYRVIQLPSPIDPDSAEAAYKNGVLEVKFKKTKIKRIEKKVKIK